MSLDQPCDICGATLPNWHYEGGNCPRCGQRYDWEEAMIAMLSDEQWEILREAFRVNGVSNRSGDR